MTMITIPQKKPNTGSIYDLASPDFDIKIDMEDNYKYTVILPSYVNATPTRHKIAYSAYYEYKRLENQGFNSHVILDREGKQVETYILLDFYPIQR